MTTHDDDNKDTKNESGLDSVLTNKEKNELHSGELPPKLIGAIKSFNPVKYTPKFERKEFVQVSRQDILDYLNETVSGQAEAKESLASIGYLFNMKCLHLDADAPPDDLPRLNLFLSGPTGYGKTFLLTQLAKILNVPFLRVDCSSITQEGWSGASIGESILSSKLHDRRALHHGGIILLDELDKLSTGAKSETGALPHQGTQHNLLDLLDGKFKTNPKEGGGTRIDEVINNSLIVCAGSFEGVRKKARDAKPSIGFKEDESKKMDHSKLSMESWKNEMVKAGLIPELVGRIIHVIELKKLNEKEILDVFTKHNNSYDKYRYIAPKFKLLNKDLQDIAKECYDSPHGLRQIDSAVFNRLLDHLSEPVVKKKQRLRENMNETLNKFKNGGIKDTKDE